MLDMIKAAICAIILIAIIALASPILFEAVGFH